MKQPHQYQERILLAVTGLSPQIVTETLYALTQVQQPPFVPTRVVVITTEDGARRVRLELLSEDKAWFRRLCEEYDLPEIRFDEKDIHVIGDDAGRPMTDIRTPEQNSQVADQISEIVRGLAADEHSAIHASIAGGRKTMGFYLGYALSLYGRPQDRLSHVLVDEGFEGNREFFYPSPRPRTIHDREQNPMDASQARVMLADIPFVRLRDGLPERLLAGTARFSETIEAAQRFYQEPELIVRPGRCQLVCNGGEIKLSPVPFALYLTMVKRMRKEMDFVGWDDEGFKADFLSSLARLVPVNSAKYENAEKAMREDFVELYFAPHMSRINKALEEQLGSRGARPFLIQAQGPRGAKRYGLALEPDQVRIESDA